MKYSDRQRVFVGIPIKLYIVFSKPCFMWDQKIATGKIHRQIFADTLKVRQKYLHRTLCFGVISNTGFGFLLVLCFN